MKISEKFVPLARALQQYGEEKSLLSQLEKLKAVASGRIPFNPQLFPKVVKIRFFVDKFTVEIRKRPLNTPHRFSDKPTELRDIWGSGASLPNADLE